MQTDLSPGEHSLLCFYESCFTLPKVWWVDPRGHSWLPAEDLPIVHSLVSRGLLHLRAHDGKTYVRLTEDGELLARIYGEP